MSESPSMGPSTATSLDPKDRRFLVWISLLALVLRLAPVLLAHNLRIGLDDMFQYDMLARSIVAGNGYRWYAEEDLARIQKYISMPPPPDYDPRGVLTSFRAPGYPAFLALIYAVNGVGPGRFFAARLVQALLSATLPLMTWALARQVGFGQRAARWAAISMAGFPLLLIYPLALGSENLFIPLLTGSLILVLRAGTRRRPGDFALAGLALGLTALTRSVVAGFVPLVMAWLWWVAQDRRAVLRSTILLLACFALLTVPWAVRNTRLHGRLTWIETSLGYNMYLGYHPESSGTFQFGISLDLLPIFDDAERHLEGMRASRQFIQANPARVPYLMVRKAGYVWGLDKRELVYFYANGFVGRWPPALLGLTFLLACGPFVLLALAGAAGLACGRLGRGKVLLGGLLIYYTGIHSLIMGAARFHAPLLPVIAVLAAYAAVRRPWRQSRPWQRGVALLLVGLLLANWGLEIARDWDTLVALFGPHGHHLYLPY